MLARGSASSISRPRASACLSCSSVKSAMDSLPVLQERVPALDHLGKQPSQVRPLDADAPYQLRPTSRSQEVDLRLALSPHDVNLRRLMIEPVNHEPETMSAVDDHHGLCQSNGRSSARGATRPPSSDIQAARTRHSA